MIVLLVRCPRCKQTMKYHTYDAMDTIAQKRKTCVYCNRSFKVRDNLLRQL